MILYPDGYDENNYYNYDWNVLDNSIVSIIGDKKTSSVTIKGISEGNTVVECKVSTIDESMTPIIKSVNVNVTNDKDDIESNNDDIDDIESNNDDIEKQEVIVPNTKASMNFTVFYIVLIIIIILFIVYLIIRRKK